MINTAIPVITTPIIDILFTAGSVIFDIIMSLFWQAVTLLGLGGGGVVCGDVISSIGSFILSYISNSGIGTILNNIIGGIAGVC